MSVLIVGSTALDSIKTPKSENPKLLGGSASHAGVAASFFSPVQLIGVVGEDFPKRYLELYRRHRSTWTGCRSCPGKTFHWSGRIRAEHEQPAHAADGAGRVRDVQPHPAQGAPGYPFRPAREHRPRPAKPCARPDAKTQVRRGGHHGPVAEHCAAGPPEADQTPGRLRPQRQRSAPTDQGRQRFRGAQEDSQTRAQIRDYQARLPRLHSVRSARPVPLPGLSAAEGGGPDGRGGFVRGRHDGLPGRRPKARSTTTSAARWFTAAWWRRSAAKGSA